MFIATAPWGPQAPEERHARDRMSPGGLSQVHEHHGTVGRTGPHVIPAVPGRPGRQTAGFALRVATNTSLLPELGTRATRAA